MLDHMYSMLTGKVPYKLLLIVPAIIVLMVSPYMLNVPKSIDFAGGVWIQVTTKEEPAYADALMKDLKDAGLDKPKMHIGYIVDSNITSIGIETTSNATVVEEKNVRGIIEKYTGKLSEYDRIVVFLPEGYVIGEPTMNRLKERFSDVAMFNNTLEIKGFRFMDDDRESIGAYFKDANVSVELQKANLGIRSVDPIMGSTFMKQATTALIVGYVLMVVLVLVAFRDFIPSVAVVASATLDVLFAFGCMGVFGIELSPASFAALIMLISYSVDTDIMLTARVLKKGKENMMEEFDRAMKTGITMTLTTYCALTAILIVTTWIIFINVLAEIATVLLFGLTMDILATWLMNTGILRWYLARPEKFRLGGLKISKRFSIFSK